jgi:hypothetical protein
VQPGSHNVSMDLNGSQILFSENEEIMPSDSPVKTSTRTQTSTHRQTPAEKQASAQKRAIAQKQRSTPKKTDEPADAVNKTCLLHFCYLLRHLMGSIFNNKCSLF